MAKNYCDFTEKEMDEFTINLHSCFQFTTFVYNCYHYKGDYCGYPFEIWYNPKTEEFTWVYDYHKKIIKDLCPNFEDKLVAVITL